MPLILRLCLDAVDTSGVHLHLWLSYSLLSTTKVCDVVRFADRTVQERMGAVLAGYDGKFALCMQDREGKFIYLGSSPSTAGLNETPITQMPFFGKLVRPKLEKMASSTTPGRDGNNGAWQKLVLISGALVPFSDLHRLNRTLGGRGVAQFPLYVPVDVPKMFRTHPFSSTDSTPLSLESSLNDMNDTFCGQEANNNNHVEDKDASFNCAVVYYVDLEGRQHSVMPQGEDLKTLASFKRAVCEMLEVQVLDAPRACDVKIVSTHCVSNESHSVEDDTALANALSDKNVRLYASSNRDKPVLTLQAHGLETSGTAADSLGCVQQVNENSLDRAEVAEWDANSVLPESVAVQMCPNEPIDDSLGKSASSGLDRPPVSSRWAERLPTALPRGVTRNASEEEEALTRLCAAHRQLDEAVQHYKAVTQEAEEDTVALKDQKEALLKELEMCLSAEEDCKRLKRLVAWLEKDIADTRDRQERLIRAIYVH
ncbi:hypothetical protein ERJ75_000064200 [Trypanosoma vivax]|uniref:Uncharacterized protein n=1 Tax=Trypanosoma vivax (strain Y486) TaxID=1055687 RepID=G0TVK9_TRYVY|nr:hypothetical protein TRVL_00277 [Trypanosoma vivax]KAH8620620.1 hypothetical protein ERJ75_000064200 [Trypanosoma vivax]CCC47975.1 conserved hypothetical protein [Trypanosoma vivax Y486]